MHPHDQHPAFSKTLDVKRSGGPALRLRSMDHDHGPRCGRRAFLRRSLGGALAIIGLQAACQRQRPAPTEIAAPAAPEARPAREAPPLKEPAPDPQRVVAIVRGDDPARMVSEAVSLAGGLAEVVYPGATVFIKPNLTIPSASGGGNVTDSRVVQATIELCQQAGASRVLIGDGSGGGDTWEIMRQAGYEPVLRATGASFVDLNQDEAVMRRPDKPLGLAEYSFARTALEAPVLISLAVLKLHNDAIVSLSCKNLVGITALRVYGRPRQQLHDAGVQRVVADIVHLRRPDFAIIDGIVGLEGDCPMNGTPVPMGLIIAGRNPVNVDSVGAAIMGLDPQKLEQLVLLKDMGLGETDVSKIVLRGNTTIAAVKRSFKRY